MCLIQESVLGGSLFNVYINDIDDAVTTEDANIWKIANNSKIAKVISYAQDGSWMQIILNNLEDWANTLFSRVHATL